MRVILYVLILALLLLAPVERLDVARLEPVQTVAVSIKEDAVLLQTDTENAGRGTDIDSAIENLEQATPGVIYLDTAQYLLVAEDAVACVEVLKQYLHPSVKVSLWDGEGSVQDAAKYLGVRKKLPQLRDWNLPAEKS